jgi:hypothetical protein
MTRRGTLIYYLAAWILGCFFMTLAIWLKDAVSSSEQLFRLRSAFGLISFYFYGLILGAFAAFVAAFLLRRVMSALRCRTPGHWAAVGAFVAPALLAAAGFLGRRLNHPEMPRLTLAAVVTLGPQTVLEAGWWLAIPAGAITAYLLCRIDRAFAPPQKAD